MSKPKNVIPQGVEVILVVNAPEITLTEDEEAGEAILKFYKALGWNGTDILDPRKVRTTKAVFDQLYGIMYEKCPDPVTIGMIIVNWGPGVDNDIALGKVRLLNGWITPPPEHRPIKTDCLYCLEEFSFNMADIDEIGWVSCPKCGGKHETKGFI